MKRRLTVLAGLLVGLSVVWLFVGCGGSSPSFVPPTTDIYAGSRGLKNVELSFHLTVGDPDDPDDPEEGDLAALAATMTVDSHHTYRLTSDGGTVVSSDDDDKIVVQVTGIYVSTLTTPHRDLGANGTFDLTFTVDTENGNVTVKGYLNGNKKKFHIDSKGKGQRSRGYAFTGSSSGFIYDE